MLSPDSTDLPAGDFPNFATVPTFSARAADSLHECLSSSGELLPLSSNSGHYFAFNVTTVLEVLDQNRSELERFPTGEVMLVRRYAFFEERLRAATIFKVPELLRSLVFVTEPFRDRVLERSLKGFRFEPLTE